MENAVAQDTGMLVQRLRALGDAKRLRIVAELAGGERCVCDLVEVLGEAQSLLSFHLRTLKDAGLVTDRREGRWVHYSLHAGALAELEAYVGGIRAAVEAPIRAGSVCCD